MFGMSLFDQNFERAANTLAEADDEVLQSAGLMALMRLETLNRRMRGQPTRKALTPPQLTTSTPFPTPWWRKQPSTGFTFGYPPQAQNYFGAPSSTLFGAQNTPFGAANTTAFGAAPSQNTGGGVTNGTVFGSAPPSSQGSTFGAGNSAAFGAGNSAAFGASQPPPQNASFGAPPTATQNATFGAAPTTAFVAPQPTAQNSAFGAANTTAFGIHQIPQGAVFGVPNSVAFVVPQPSAHNATFGVATSATFGAPQPPPQNTAQATVFGSSQPASQNAAGLFGAPPGGIFGVQPVQVLMGNGTTEPSLMMGYDPLYDQKPRQISLSASSNTGISSSIPTIAPAPQVNTSTSSASGVSNPPQNTSGIIFGFPIPVTGSALQNTSGFGGPNPTNPSQLQTEGETAQTAAATVSVSTPSHVSEGASNTPQVTSEEGAANNTADTQELKTITKTKPVVPKSSENLPDLDRLTLKEQDTCEKESIEPAAAKSPNKDPILDPRCKIENIIGGAAKKSVQDGDLCVANIRKEQGARDNRTVVSSLAGPEKSSIQGCHTQLAKNNVFEKSLIARKVEDKPVATTSVHGSEFFTTNIKKENINGNFLEKLHRSSTTDSYNLPEQKRSFIFKKPLLTAGPVTSLDFGDTKRDKSTDTKSVQCDDFSVTNIKKEKSYNFLKSSTTDSYAFAKRENWFDQGYQHQAAKNNTFEKSLVSARSGISLDRVVEEARRDSLHTRHSLVQTQNFTKGDSPSYTFNYTQLYQPQTYHISNTLINLNSVYEARGALPRSSGGCSCRQIQCADRRCGCKKSGTMCGSGCLCSSRGGWCLNR